jgi:hypothetical protein
VRSSEPGDKCPGHGTAGDGHTAAPEVRAAYAAPGIAQLYAVAQDVEIAPRSRGFAGTPEY